MRGSTQPRLLISANKCSSSTSPPTMNCLGIMALTEWSDASSGEPHGLKRKKAFWSMRYIVEARCLEGVDIHDVETIRSDSLETLTDFHRAWGIKGIIKSRHAQMIVIGGTIWYRSARLMRCCVSKWRSRDTLHILLQVELGSLWHADLDH